MQTTFLSHVGPPHYVQLAYVGDPLQQLGVCVHFCLGSETVQVLADVQWCHVVDLAKHCGTAGERMSQMKTSLGVMCTRGFATL